MLSWLSLCSNLILLFKYSYVELAEKLLMLMSVNCLSKNEMEHDLLVVLILYMSELDVTLFRVGIRV